MEDWIKDLREFVCDSPDPDEYLGKIDPPHILTKEDQIKGGKISGKYVRSNKKGIFAPDYDRTPVARLAGKLSTGGIVCRDNQLGFHSLPKEIVNQFRKRGREQKYRCLVTGYISNACGLSNYQKGRGINYKDKSLRERVE
jgi:hypothetical protein